MAKMGNVKKRKATPAIEEINFDADAREEWLSGFRKRKQARIKHAQGIAAEKERQAKIDERKALREQRAKDLADHIKKVDELLKANRKAEGNDSSSEGEDEDEEAAVLRVQEEEEREDEYVDEDKYTTVTIAPMNLSDEEEVKESTQKDDDEGSEEGDESKTAGRVAPSNGKKTWTKEKPARDKPKKKKKKFRYESKEERKMERFRQKSRNAKAAQARKV